MPAALGSLVEGDAPLDFYVWVDPRTFLVRANVTATGRFASGKNIEPAETLPFEKNAKFGGFVTPFLQNVTHNYGVEYNLEVRRRLEFKSLPSRMQALFLFSSTAIAWAYARSHRDHVGGRTLQRVRTVGPYRYSAHDSGWIDYMRIPHFWTAERAEEISRGYWRGDRVEDFSLTSFGQGWTAPTLPEALLLGSVEFHDRSFLTTPPSIGMARMINRTPSPVFSQFLESQKEWSDSVDPSSQA